MDVAAAGHEIATQKRKPGTQPNTERRVSWGSVFKPTQARRELAVNWSVVSLFAPAGEAVPRHHPFFCGTGSPSRWMTWQRSLHTFWRFSVVY